MPISGSLIGMLLLLLVLVALAWSQGGEELVRQGFGRGGSLLWEFGLLIAVSFLAAGFATVLLPRDWIEGAFGAGSGLRGILLATAGGALTPAGPFVAMPLAAVLIRSGAAAGPVVAFLTGWSVLALHRVLAWEIPILGARFALMRFTVSLVLPVIAGLMARALTR